MVARQPIHPDFIGRECLGANLMRGTRILGPFVAKLIDRLRTNGKRVLGKQAFLRYLDTGNFNFRPADRGD
jgi:hypothetical protein